MNFTTFSCSCKEKKQYKLVFDGGVLGTYTILQCVSCYLSQNKKFLISEEKINE